MIERLEQLTLSQFVDLVCGDTTIMRGKGNTDKTAIALRNIVMEYRSIADQIGRAHV